MSDLIDRQAAIDALIRKTRPHDNGDGTTTICVMSEGLVREVITDLPAAEPRKGRWSIEDCHAATYKYCCSECKAHHRARYDYCPTCGTRMEET